MNNKNIATTIKSIQDGIVKHAPMLRGSPELKLGIFIPLAELRANTFNQVIMMHANIV
jgi:hypothetical protein